MLFTEDATFYAQAVKDGDSTVTELVTAALDNIQKYNDQLNAVVYVQAEEAMAAAAELDQKLASLSAGQRQKLPAFYGVPVLLKDAGHKEKGQPATSGSRLLKDQTASETSHFVQDILEAGFVVVGRTNVPEFALKGISDSLFYGSVNLPQDLKRNAGGSSGGAAAAVKAGLVPMATASDGGGSIRIPAAFTGLLGLKISNGRTAHGPDSYRNWQGAAVDFAVTRSVRDTWQLLKSLQLEEYRAPFTLPEIKEERLAPLNHPLKIAYLSDWSLSDQPDADGAAMMEQAKTLLEDLGHEVTADYPDFDAQQTAATYFTVYAVETAKDLKRIVEERGREISEEEVEPITWALYQIGQQIPAVEYAETLDFWDQLGAQIHEYFENYDLVLLPTSTEPAPIHGTNADQQEAHKDLFKDILKVSFEEQIQLITKAFEPSIGVTPYTSQVNVSDSTAISLPLYETEEGLPIGTMLWAAKGQEYLLLQVARQLEEQGYLKSGIYQLDE